MRRIVMFLSLILMAGSFAAALRWPTPTGATVPRADTRATQTPVPTPVVEASSYKVPVAPVYTLAPSPSATPVAAVAATPTPSPTPSPSVKAKCKGTCDGANLKPGDTCRVVCD